MIDKGELLCYNLSTIDQGENNMKKLAAVLCVMTLFTVPQLSHAAYSQYNIYNSIQNAYAWMEENSSPLSSTDYAVSDHYITAVA